MDSMKRPLPPLTRCVSSRPCKTDRPWIRQQLCTWYFNWRTEHFGDESYAKHEVDGIGAAGGNDHGSGPAAGVRAAEPTAGFDNPTGTSAVRSVSGQSGAPDHDGPGSRPRRPAGERPDQVSVAAHSHCGDLSPEPDAGSATRADSAGRPLLPGTHGLERLHRPQRLPFR